MFELLFKEPLSVWREADLVLASGWSVTALAIAVAVAGLAILMSLWRAPVSPGRRLALGGLQWLVAAVALTMLWRPALELERTRPGENAVAWLLDTSASMDVGDAAGRARRSAVADALLDGELLEDERFTPRLFTLGEEARPLESFARVEDLPAASARSAIADGLENVLTDVGDTSLAAVVLLSDGADNVGEIDARWWRRLAASGVPVHTVGVGAIADDGDVELADVTLPARAAVGAGVTARLRIVHGPGDGQSLRKARLRITDGDALILADDLTLLAGATETVHTVVFEAGDAGLKRLDFALEIDAGDAEARNDRQSRIIDVRESPRRVLYVEGEPRWEYKFLRRAMDDQAGLEVASLLRTSPNKFYRQGVRDGQELADGFPRTREALFAYDAVIIGSLAAAELDGDQQAALRDFVSLRGGSLLMLAGRRGLADGGWARSGVAAALPVALDARRGATTFSRERVSVRPTRQGLRTPWLRLTGNPVARASAAGAGASTAADGEGVDSTGDRLVELSEGVGDGTSAAGAAEPDTDGDANDGLLPDPDDGRTGGRIASPDTGPVTPSGANDEAALIAEVAAWTGLPDVADHQALGTPKPGARVLLENGDGDPMLVVQRYGRGTSLVLGTSGTWRWQMGLPSDDDRHERFWRSMIGVLAARAQPRLELSAGPAVLRDGDETRVTVDALGADFEPLVLPTLAARITAPDGSSRSLELVADAVRPGRYAAALAIDADGPWGVAVTSPPEGESPATAPVSAEAWVLRETGTAEAFGARQQRDFLQRVAAVTGGRHLPLADIEELPAALERDNAALTRSELLPLWNLPLLFVLLAIGKGLEWLLRLRWKRL